MKKIIINLFLSFTVLIAVTSSCTDDIMDEIDANPNSPLDVPLNLLLPQVIAETAFAINGTDLAWYSSVFVEHTTGVHGQLEEADKRTGINTTIVANSWESIYASALQDIQIIINKGSDGGEEEGNWAYVGIAKVLKAYILGITTDAWGRIPYTEALQGSANTQPAFDSQETIYQELQNILDGAIADLAKESLSDPGAVDFIYEGDTDLWTKAAYALKARFHNRLSNINPQQSATLALDAASKSFESPEESMIFTSFNTDATGQHPWFQELNDRSHHAVSTTIDGILVGLNDPRREHFFGTVGGEIVPAPNGTAIADQGGDIYSRASSNVVYATAPMPLMTYDELKFIEAEANLRLDQDQEAYDAYLDAVESAMGRGGIAEEDVTEYLDQNSIAPGAEALDQEDILLQKYISFWLFQPIEAYNDYRRTGIPTMNNTVSPPPARFPYSQDEIAANPANIPDVALTNGVWWADGSDD